jgi:hypothetical protein
MDTVLTVVIALVFVLAGPASIIALALFEKRRSGPL